MGFKNLPRRLWAIENFRLFFIATGIIGGFSTFAVMQEKITRKSCFGGIINKDGKCEGNEKFEYEMVLVGLLSIWYAIVAKRKLKCKKCKI